MNVLAHMALVVACLAFAVAILNDIKNEALFFVMLAVAIVVLLLMLTAIGDDWRVIVGRKHTERVVTEEIPEEEE